MSRNQYEDGRISNHSRGLGSVTPEMVRSRARELAIINGRSPAGILDSDWAQARREMMGEGDESPQDKVLESLPESERWDPVPGSLGRKAPTVFADDEQIADEKLILEGVDEAEHDEMLLAIRESIRNARNS